LPRFERWYGFSANDAAQGGHPQLRRENEDKASRVLPRQHLTEVICLWPCSWPFFASEPGLPVASRGLSWDWGIWDLLSELENSHEEKQAARAACPFSSARALRFVRVKPRPLQQQISSPARAVHFWLRALARLRITATHRVVRYAASGELPRVAPPVRQEYATRNRNACRMMSRRPLPLKTLYDTQDAHLLELESLETAFLLAQSNSSVV